MAFKDLIVVKSARYIIIVSENPYRIEDRWKNLHDSLDVIESEGGNGGSKYKLNVGGKTRELHFKKVVQKNLRNVDDRGGGGS